MDNSFDTMWSGFIDEIEKIALMGAPKAGLVRRMLASPKAVTRGTGKAPGAIRSFLHGGPRRSGALRGLTHSRLGRWATTYKPSRFGEMAGQTAGMIGLSKAMSPGQEQQGY